MKRKRFYTSARRRFLVSLLLDTNKQQIFNSSVWSDIPFGTLRASAKARPMLEPLQERGIIEWDYAKCYTIKNYYDVRLTDKGYHKAVQCLLYAHRDSSYGAFRRGPFVNKRKHPG